MNNFFQDRLDKKGRYKSTALLDSELVKALQRFEYIYDFRQLIQDALWHFITCPLAESNGKSHAVARQQRDLGIEARLTRVEKELRISQEI